MIRPTAPVEIEQQIVYAPAIANKQGEQDALTALRHTERYRILPVIMVLRRPRYPRIDPTTGEKKVEEKTIERHARHQCDRIEAILENDMFSAHIQRVALDLWALTRAERACHLDLFEKILRDGLHASIAPVIYPGQPVDHLQQAVDWSQRHRSGLCLRLRIRKNRSFPTREDVDALLQDCGIKRGETDLLIDAMNITSSDIEPYASAIADLLKELGPQWRSTVMLSGSFPSSLKKLEYDVIHELPRLELNLWRAVQQQLGDQATRLIFGDYGMTYPFLADGGLPPDPNFRYAGPQSWMVVRKTGPDAMPLVCRAIVNAPWYGGADASHADAWLARVSQRLASPGNGTVWAREGWSRHLAQTLRQLTSGS